MITLQQERFSLKCNIPSIFFVIKTIYLKLVDPVISSGQDLNYCLYSGLPLLEINKQKYCVYTVLYLSHFWLAWSHQLSLMCSISIS